MNLTEHMKQQAAELGLTQTDAEYALATRVSLTRWAEIKAEIAAEREDENAMMQRFTTAVGEGLTDAYRGGRGAALPPLEGDA